VRDGLADPPLRAGGEAVAAPVVEAVDGAHQAEVPLLDQVTEVETAVAVAPRDGGDETEVRLDENPLGRLYPLLRGVDRGQRALESGCGHTGFAFERGQLAAGGALRRSVILFQRGDSRARLSLALGELPELSYDPLDGSRLQPELVEGDAHGAVHRATRAWRPLLGERPDACDAGQQAAARGLFRGRIIGFDAHQVPHLHLAGGQPSGQPEDVA